MIGNLMVIVVFWLGVELIIKDLFKVLICLFMFIRFRE